MKMGWTISPTAKSDKARLDSSVFAGECNAVVFQIAVNVAKFPKSAIGQSKIFKTHMTTV